MSSHVFHRGSLPLLISIPHAGTAVPETILDRFTDAGRALPDTDWFVDRLYDFAEALGASTLKAIYSRYVVDLNRAPDSTPLYPSAASSPVCPTLTFAGKSIYQDGAEPDVATIERRVQEYWHPYHQCIAEELWRIRSEHGYALLWDAHSVASQVPALFTGELPQFNLGTRDGAACPPTIARALLQVIQDEGRYSAVLNGRFKGGYITLAYGRPEDAVLAVQLELAQRTYMNEAPHAAWDDERAGHAAVTIRNLLNKLLDCARK